MGNIDFKDLDYNGFKELAKNSNLSKYEKIGFPDAYRAGYEELIFIDICSKLTNLGKNNIEFLEVGPGCSELPGMLMELCKKKESKVTFMDSKEMLDLLGDGFEKVQGRFPEDAENLLRENRKFDAILCYSVFHYLVADTPIFKVIDNFLALLKPGGQLLLGDIPNISYRKRFFNSDKGRIFHKEFTKSNEDPKVAFGGFDKSEIDDSTLQFLLARCRAFGFNSYILQQNPDLPMANRREDFFVERP